MRNIIFTIILCVSYLYFGWYIKDKNRRKLADLMDKQVIEALTVIKNTVQAWQSLQNTINLAKNELKNPIKLEFKKNVGRIGFGSEF